MFGRRIALVGFRGAWEEADGSAGRPARGLSGRLGRDGAGRSGPRAAAGMEAGKETSRAPGNGAGEEDGEGAAARRPAFRNRNAVAWARCLGHFGEIRFRSSEESGRS